MSSFADPEGPSTKCLRILVPKTNKGIVLGPGSSNVGYLDPKEEFGLEGWSLAWCFRGALVRLTWKGWEIAN